MMACRLCEGSAGTVSTQMPWTLPQHTAVTGGSYSFQGQKAQASRHEDPISAGTHLHSVKPESRKLGPACFQRMRSLP